MIHFIRSIPPFCWFEGTDELAMARSSTSSHVAQTTAMVALRIFSITATVGCSVIFLATGSTLAALGALGFGIASLALLHATDDRVHRSTRPFFPQTPMFVSTSTPVPTPMPTVPEDPPSTIFLSTTRPPSPPPAYYPSLDSSRIGVGNEQRTRVGDGRQPLLEQPLSFNPAQSTLRNERLPVGNGGSVFSMSATLDGIQNGDERIPVGGR